MENLTTLLKMDLKRIYESQLNEMPENKLNLIFISLKYFFTSKSFRSILFYRLLSHKFFDNKEILKSIMIIFRKLLFCLEIPPTARIEGGLLIGYPQCVILNYKCVIGKNVTIQQGVTLGGNMGKIIDGREAPVVEDNVFLGPGAKILGPVIIGKNSIIGANAVVINDIPPDSIAVGLPAKVIKKVEKNFLEIQKEWKNHLLTLNNNKVE